MNFKVSQIILVIAIVAASLVYGAGAPTGYQVRSLPRKIQTRLTKAKITGGPFDKTLKYDFYGTIRNPVKAVHTAADGSKIVYRFQDKSGWQKEIHTPQQNGLTKVEVNGQVTRQYKDMPDKGHRIHFDKEGKVKTYETFKDENGVVTKRIYENGKLGSEAKYLFTEKDGFRTFAEGKNAGLKNNNVAQEQQQQAANNNNVEKASKGWSGKKIAGVAGASVLSLLLLGYLMNNMKKDRESEDSSAIVKSSDPMAMDASFSSSSSIPPFASAPAMANVPSSPMVF